MYTCTQKCIYIYTHTSHTNIKRKFYPQVPALVKAKKSHALLEAILRDFANAIDLSIVEDIASFLAILEDGELEECFSSVPWSSSTENNTEAIVKNVAETI